ncbi:2393_t:CDS:2 [Scutellospora calospora]|uniref:2393_t:CDS:1 n=1 Tax=Scutellospora calospora TaxID=85575 RepID=A0ACA9JZP0_9GLOM|nr:2393_t:CDS:2 [Scutellospora calospora]
MWLLPATLLAKYSKGLRRSGREKSVKILDEPTQVFILKKYPVEELITKARFYYRSNAKKKANKFNILMCWTKNLVKTLGDRINYLKEEARKTDIQDCWYARLSIVCHIRTRNNNNDNAVLENYQEAIGCLNLSLSRIRRELRRAKDGEVDVLRDEVDEFMRERDALRQYILATFRGPAQPWFTYC